MESAAGFNVPLDGAVPFHPTNNIIDAERIRMSIAIGGERQLTSHLLGGIHRDSSGKLWSIYLAEADDQDDEITELWRGEADSILVFVSATVTYPLRFRRSSEAITKTGLFASVIATFLSMSYNNLVPGGSVTTNALLTQISSGKMSSASENKLSIITGIIKLSKVA